MQREPRRSSASAIGTLLGLPQLHVESARKLRHHNRPHAGPASSRARVGSTQPTPAAAGARPPGAVGKGIGPTLVSGLAPPGFAIPPRPPSTDADDDVTSTSEASHRSTTFEAPAPVLTWSATFEDRDVEGLFVATDLKPVYAVRTGFVGLLFLGAWLPLVGIEASALPPGAGAADSPALWLCVAGAAACAGKVVLAWLTQALRLRLRWLEAYVTSAMLLEVFALALVFSPRRLAAVLGSPPAAAGWDHSAAEVLLRVAVVPLVSSTLIPIQPVAWCIFTALLLALLTALQLAVPRGGGGGGGAGGGGAGGAGAEAISADASFVEASNTVAFLLLLFGSGLAGRFYLVLSRRIQFHFRRSVVTALADKSREARERRRLQEEHRSAREEAISADAAKTARSRLIRMVMHDLRSPLLSVTNLAASLQALAPNTRLDAPPVRTSLDALVTCATLMEHIVVDMLDFERIDAGRLELQRSPFYVTGLLRDVLATFGGIAKAKGVSLLALPPPEPLPSLRLVGDARRLQQCLNNLVSNAIKFAERGGTVTVRAVLAGSEPMAPPGTAHQSSSATDPGGGGGGGGAGGAVGVPAAAATASSSAAAAAAAGRGGGARRAGGTPPPPPLGRVASEPGARGEDAGDLLTLVRVSVSDDGIGLSAEELRMLSQGLLFQQVGKGQLQGNGGTGLGLSITRQLLALHNGSTLELESAGHMRGTTSTLCLRLPQDAAASSPRAERCGSEQQLCVSAVGSGTPLSSAPSTNPGTPGGGGGGGRFGRTDSGGGGSTSSSSPMPRKFTTGATGKGGSMSGGWGARADAVDLASMAQISGGGRTRAQHPSARNRAHTMHQAALESQLPNCGAGSPLARAHSYAQRACGARPPGARQLAPLPLDSTAEGDGSPEQRTGPGPQLPGAPPLAEEVANALASAEANGAVARRSGGSSAPDAAADAADADDGGATLVEPFTELQQPGARSPGAPSAPPAPTALPPAAGPRPHGPLRCLYVEDDQFLQLTVPTRIFDAVGVTEWASAADGEAAVEALYGPGGTQYDVIVMDNQMPRMNGTEATRELRRRGFGGLVVGMTGDPAGCVERDDFEGSGLDLCVDKDTTGINTVAQLIEAEVAKRAGAAAGGGGGGEGGEAAGAEPGRSTLAHAALHAVRSQAELLPVLPEQ